MLASGFKLLAAFVGATCFSCFAVAQERQVDNFSDSSTRSAEDGTAADSQGELARATFGNGCFWCTEAVFQRVKGVSEVVSGYMGGKVPNPTYEQVSTKKTGHAEVLHLRYDPKVVSYEKLLEIFWKTHDPTTPNRQGNDVGPQYRSVIFYHDDSQRELAEKYKKLLDQSKAFSKPIVTEISPAATFYPAEDYHQNYYNLNKNANPYCRMIQYKLEKFREVFPDQVDPEKDRVK
ncbi:MAG: peptide-methionine (S)-S-oxide reductase MsrA [Pirellulaceae bacterium]|nr:peptide-methionine (S)-S-oxide reductase MsrA [Pirellulaceae bacterium]